MAEYKNLISLQGLSVGDIITYDTTTAIDFKGYKVKVELHGKNSYKEGTSGGLPVTKTAIGGLTTAIVDSSKTASKIFTVVYGTDTRTGRCDLCYGDSSDLYYRILTVGFASEAYGISGSNNAGCNGGGETGSSKNSNTNGKAGTQTSGGAGGGESILGYAGNGGFGYGGTNKSSGTDGSYGWYGGGGGRGTSGGSGSGFVIGVTTTTYPSGYLGNDTSLQETIAASITEGSTTLGGATKSTATAPAIVLTIIEVGETGSSQSVIQYYNGTEFIDTNAKYYNGSEFIDCDAYYYDGTEFRKI